MRVEEEKSSCDVQDVQRLSGFGTDIRGIPAQIIQESLVFLLNHCRVSNCHCVFYYFSSACVQACYNIPIIYLKPYLQFVTFADVFWILSLCFDCCLVAEHSVIKLIKLFYMRNYKIVTFFFFTWKTMGGCKRLHCIIMLGVNLYKYH